MTFITYPLDSSKSGHGVSLNTKLSQNPIDKFYHNNPSICMEQIVYCSPWAKFRIDRSYPLYENYSIIWSPGHYILSVQHPEMITEIRSTVCWYYWVFQFPFMKNDLHFLTKCKWWTLSLFLIPGKPLGIGASTSVGGGPFCNSKWKIYEVLDDYCRKSDFIQRGSNAPEGTSSSLIGCQIGYCTAAKEARYHIIQLQ